MNKKILSLSLCGMLLSAALWPNISLAEDRFVSDVMYIPLRKAPGSKQEIIIRSLASGTQLTFIREELDSNKVSWSLVKTAEGVLGWARTQYLTDEPTAALKLPILQQSYDDVAYKLDQLTQTSASSINIEQENRQLHERYQLLQTRADILQAENDQLKNADRFNQWLYGGGLLLCGVILSFLLQAFGKRKRQSDWR